MKHQLYSPDASIESRNSNSDESWNEYIESFRTLQSGKYNFGPHGQYTIKARNIEYSIHLARFTRKRPLRTILKQCSFDISPGKLLAIFGLSGGGKSTLIDILAGVIPPDKYAGCVLANDQLKSRKFRNKIGYVRQSDALYPMLTIKETFYYAARLRVRGLSREDLEGLVNMTLDLLHLSSVQNSYVGNESIRGVSGGERRRCTIGVDIIHQPSIIYLDEPTSGLDSLTALSVVKVLKEICIRGPTTVCMAIHQPSIQVYNLMDEAIFLHKGQILYNGPAQGISEYLKKTFQMDIPTYANLVEIFFEYVANHEHDKDFQQKARRNSSEHSSTTENTSVLMIHPQNPTPSKSRTFLAFTSSLMVEAYILGHRKFVNIVRTPELFGVIIVCTVLFALMLGSVFRHTGYETVPDVESLGGFFVFALGNFMFRQTTIGSFFLEYNTVRRELCSGAYRSISYNISLFLESTATFLVFTFVFHISSYFFIGFPPSAGVFFFQWLVYYVFHNTIASLYLMISTMCNGLRSTMIVSTFVCSIMYLLSGVFISSGSLSSAWSALKYVNAFTVTLHALLMSVLDVSNLSDAEFEEVWNKYGEPLDPNKHVLILVQVVMIFGFRVLFNIFLVWRTVKRS